jgi:hypothetical protein
MQRKQIYIAGDQEEALERIAQAKNTSVSAVIREAVAAYIVDQAEPDLASAEEHPLWAIVGSADDLKLPKDGSVAHDEVVYRPRRPRRTR